VKEQLTGFEELLENYENAMKEAGLGYSTRLRKLKYASGLIGRHEKIGLTKLDDDVVSEFTGAHNKNHYERNTTVEYYRQRNRDIEHFLNFAETGSTELAYPLKGSRFSLTPEFEKIADAFLASGDFQPNTRNDMRWVSHKYFTWLAEHDITEIKSTGAEIIQRFMLDCAKDMLPNSMHNLRLYLKKLYAFLYAEGLSKSAYSELLSFKVNREHKVFPVLPRDDINKLLAAIDRKTKTGKRAYAVMLLGAELGLRACDVVGMRLGDIDWTRGEIKIIQSKTSNPLVLPLEKNVGEALMDYILNARPKTDCDQIFLRIHHPHTPLKAAVTLGEIYRDCCKAAGIESNKRFHTLRRSLATGMVTNGVDIYTVAQILGDTNIESTKPYIALDSLHLKQCALPFDGFAPKGGDVL
jgi:site-specific recombinase XerD